jgi:gliding motility-associated-like protein
VKEYGLNDQRSNKWYFGNKAGIDFTTNRALNDSGMTAPEGCAIVCDRNGQTIFYTDGNTVYDRTNNAIDTGIGGSIDGASSQSSLIFQVPGDESLYYIFTTQAFEDGSANEARYSLFDWKKNNGKGGLVQKNVLLFSKTTERITANGNWVIFHEYGNNVFRSYRITQEGIGAPVFSSVGTDHSQCEGGAEGYMKLGPKNTLAVPLTYNGGNFIELFHLNDTTGRVVKFSKTEANNKLNLNESAGKVYGIEFTSSNKKGLKLFATVNNDANSKFIEFAIDSLSKPTLLKSTPAADLGAIQTAPNGAIYVAVKGSKSLSVIGPGGDLTSPSSLQSDGFMLADGTTSALGLPNFRQQQGNGFGSPALTFTGVCAGDSTRFTGEGTDSIDKFAWSVADSKDPTKTFPFKDPTKQNPAILLPAGDYIVSLRVYNRCSLDTTLTAKFSVFAPPAKVLLPSQSLCNGPVTLNANPSKTAGLTYSWSTGETTPTILVSKPILDISVTITNDKGCSTKSTTGVASSSVEFQLVADQTICQNVAVAPIKPFVYTTGYSYEWTIKNETTGSTTAGTGEQQAVDTSTPGIFSYSVKITDSNGCFATDDVKFTINPAPNVTLPLPDDPSGCGVADGKIQIILTNSIPPGGPYSISLDGPTPTQLFDKTVALSPIPISGLKAGGYVVTVSDQLSGCSTIKSIGLTDASWTIISTPTACDPSSVTTSVASGSPSPGELTFTFRGTGVGSPILSVTPLLTTTVLVPQGTWTAEAKDVSGCTAVDPTPLVVTPNPTITITPNASCSSLTATISQAGNFDILWTLPSGGTVSGPTVAANSPGDYLATATKQGVVPSCSFSTTYQLKVVNPTIKQSETCSDEVILTAAPSGNYYRYTWTGGPNNNTFYGQQIALGVGEGGTYTVTVKDTQTGCSKTSTIDAKVAGKVTAYLSSTPPCKDGKPFTLTATATPSTGVNYNWFFNGSPIAGVTTDSKSISQLEEGVYQVKVSSVADPTCKAEPSVTIVRNPSPEGNLPPAAIICADPDNKDPLTAKVDLDPGTFTRYQWYKNDAALSGETKQIYTATSPGLYRVDIGNSYNCVASDKTEVRNECIPKLVAPTAFRPGSKEPTNQNFFVYSFFITDQFEVSIFNRWGELVYESKDKNFKWNGTYNNQGQPLPAGTYAYSIKYISSFRPDKGIQEQRGGVVLIR